MSTDIIFNEEARAKMLAGITLVSKCVSVTLGPCGRNVMLPNGNITKDGISVAKVISSSDPFVAKGAKLVITASQKANENAGDGTSTTAVLVNAIAREGLKNVTAGANPIELKKGMDAAVDAIINEVEKNAIKVTDKKAIAQVGTISANGDEEIGNLLADAMEKVGNDGVITIEESRTADTVLDVVEGMQFGNGYLSPYFSTEENMSCVLENPVILMYGHKISTMKELVPTLEFCAQNNKPLLIIAEDVDGEALAALVINKMRGTIKVAAVKAPGYGDSRINNLKDIAVLTGGTLVSDEIGVKLEEIDPSYLGSAKTVKITKDSTTIIEGAGDTEAIKAHVAGLKNLGLETESDYERSKIAERVARLSGGVAVIKVGAATEVEMKEKKDRVDDALHATKAAALGGIVPGGGVALIRAQSVLDNLKVETADQKTGVNIIRRAVEEPLRQIAQNAGKSADVIVNKVKELSGNEGYNAKTDVYENLVDSGVIDPAIVTVTALKNASSVASMVITTECVICEKTEKDSCSCHAGAPTIDGMPMM